MCGKKTGTQHFITQYLRSNIAILPEFNKTDLIHFKIDEKQAAILVFYFQNGRI